MNSHNQTILLVEPWLYGSHLAWSKGWSAHSRYNIELLGLTPQAWQTAFIKGAKQLAKQWRARRQPPPQCIIASSMLDVPTFLNEAGLEHVPVWLYMHENQLSYDTKRPHLLFGNMNWQSVKAATRVAFNSHFHKNSFFSALPLLHPNPNDVKTALDKSSVLSVGVDLSRLKPIPTTINQAPVILWNHRWEADKDPATFVQAITDLRHESFNLILAGTSRPDDLYISQLTERLGDRLLHAGYASDEAYPALLNQADMVVSTALQEFFGISIAEALYCGAMPVVPNALAYPELIPSHLHKTGLYESGDLTAALKMALDACPYSEDERATLKHAMSQYDWSNIVTRYDDALESLFI